MPCGCAHDDQPPKPRRAATTLSDAQRGRVVVCYACTMGTGSGRCAIPNPRGTDHGPLSGSCPAGKFGDAGAVYWPTFRGQLPPARTVRWLGAPYPLRLWFALRKRRYPRVPGCGCIERLKRLTTRLAETLTHAPE
jgi:hypothetical protein